MNEADSIQVVGNSLDQALIKAAGSLGTSHENIEYKILKKRGNFLSLFAGKKVEILAWRSGQTPKRKSRPTAAENRPSREREAIDLSKRELSGGEVEALIEELRVFCKGICEGMFGESVKVKAELDGERLLIDIDSDELAAQFNRNQKLAEAFEHILRKKPRHLRQELPFRIFVDVRGVRRQREDDLVQMARDLSMKVFENQRPIVLNYKSSYDRKIIHMTLDKNERVYTKSIGTGPNRKLMILPIRENGKREDAVAAKS